MSLIPDPETCYMLVKRHAETKRNYVPENMAFKQAYIKGWKDGKKKGHKICQLI